MALQFRKTTVSLISGTKVDAKVLLVARVTLDSNISSRSSTEPLPVQEHIIMSVQARIWLFRPSKTRNPAQVATSIVSGPTSLACPLAGLVENAPSSETPLDCIVATRASPRPSHILGLITLFSLLSTHARNMFDYVTSATQVRAAIMRQGAVCS